MVVEKRSDISGERASKKMPLKRQKPAGCSVKKTRKGWRKGRWKNVKATV